MKRFKIQDSRLKIRDYALRSALCVSILLGVVSMATAQETNDSNPCPWHKTYIATICIGGYQYLEARSCSDSVSIVQMFEIYRSSSGKPKMSLPVPCTDVSVPTVGE